MSSECPHTEVRRSKYVIDDRVVIACDECRALGTFWVEVMAYAKPQLDDSALVEDLHGLVLLLEACEWAHEEAHQARIAVGREVNRVYKLYNAQTRNFSPRITWRQIADHMGLTLEGLDWYREAWVRRKPLRERDDPMAEQRKNFLKRKAAEIRAERRRMLRVGSDHATASDTHGDQDGAVHPASDPDARTGI